uniref:Signal peptide protein n=1 Tax=Heterorhabditis bacteriophora TaxID=37862 RepID=A0A1I7WHE9_HETBA
MFTWYYVNTFILPLTVYDICFTLCANIHNRPQPYIRRPPAYGGKFGTTACHLHLSSLCFSYCRFEQRRHLIAQESQSGIHTTEECSIPKRITNLAPPHRRPARTWAIFRHVYTTICTLENSNKQALNKHWKIMCEAYNDSIHKWYRNPGFLSTFGRLLSRRSMSIHILVYFLREILLVEQEILSKTKVTCRILRRPCSDKQHLLCSSPRIGPSFFLTRIQRHTFLIDGIQKNSFSKRNSLMSLHPKLNRLLALVAPKSRSKAVSFSSSLQLHIAILSVSQVILLPRKYFCILSQKCSEIFIWKHSYAELSGKRYIWVLTIKTRTPIP